MIGYVNYDSFDMHNKWIEYVQCGYVTISSVHDLLIIWSDKCGVGMICQIWDLIREVFNWSELILFWLIMEIVRSPRLGTVCTP